MLPNAFQKKNVITDGKDGLKADIDLDQGNILHIILKVVKHPNAFF